MIVRFGIGTAIGFVQTLTRGARLRADLQKRLEGAGEKIVDKIREAAPDDTGALDDSVRVVPAETKPGIVIEAGGEATTRNGYDYALGIEYGTAKMPAQPYFYPTIRENLHLVDEAVSGATPGEE